MHKLHELLVVPLTILALATTAHASPAAPVAAAATTPTLRVASALFTPTRAGDGLDWRAAWVLTPESAAELAEGGAHTLRFAVPLADNVTLARGSGIMPVLENGHVVGVQLEPAALDQRTVYAVVHQHDPLVANAHLRLGAPVAAGSALQIIDGDLGSETRFEIDTGRGMEQRIGHVAPPNVGHAARVEARRLTGYDARVTGAALYVRGDDVVAANGVTATLVTPRARTRGGALAIGFAFAALVGALVIALRRVRSSATVERADVLLAAEIEAEMGKGAR